MPTPRFTAMDESWEVIAKEAICTSVECARDVPFGWRGASGLVSSSPESRHKFRWDRINYSSLVTEPSRARDRGVPQCSGFLGLSFRAAWILRQKEQTAAPRFTGPAPVQTGEIFPDQPANIVRMGK